MVAVPADTPVTIPVALTVAIEAADTLQVPDAVASVRVTVLPGQTGVAPVNAATVVGLETVIVRTAVAVPHALVTE